VKRANLTKKLIGKNLLVSDGWISNRHWAIKRGHVTEKSSVKTATVEAAQATFPGVEAVELPQYSMDSILGGVGSGQYRATDALVDCEGGKVARIYVSLDPGKFSFLVLNNEYLVGMGGGEIPTTMFAEVPKGVGAFVDRPAADMDTDPSMIIMPMRGDGTAKLVAKAIWTAEVKK